MLPGTGFEVSKDYCDFKLAFFASCLWIEMLMILPPCICSIMNSNSLKLQAQLNTFEVALVMGLYHSNKK